MGVGMVVSGRLSIELAMAKTLRQRVERDADVSAERRLQAKHA